MSYTVVGLFFFSVTRYENDFRSGKSQEARHLRKLDIIAYLDCNSGQGCVENPDGCPRFDSAFIALRRRNVKLILSIDITGGCEQMGGIVIVAVP